MDTQQASQGGSKKEIFFPNGNRAQLVAPPAGAKPADILHALGIEQPQALIMISGGAAGLDEAPKPRLVQLFSRGVARAAANTDALIIDGGTHAGVMAMMGQGTADRGRKSTLLGVAPAGKVTYPGGPAEGSIEDGAPLDPNHSHFVLVQSDEWGGETDTMYELAEALANRVLDPPPPADESSFAQDGAEASPAKIPVVTVLASGGLIAKDEVLRSVRQGWPIIVIQGSGRLADDIAKMWKKKGKGGKLARISERMVALFKGRADAVMAEIIEEGDIYLFPLDGPVTELEQLISGQLRQLREDPTLLAAWERFALYDANAQRQQTYFRRLQLWILRLGVFGTALALSLTMLRSLGLREGLPWMDWLLHYAVVALPIATATLVAAANRFSTGNKWTLLRGSAETIKREIYRYRTQAGRYSQQSAKDEEARQEKPEKPREGEVKEEKTKEDETEEKRTFPQAELAHQVEIISRQLMQTEVNLSALRPYIGPIPPKMYGAAAADDGLSFLTPDQYVTIRLGDQLNYYRGKTNKLEKDLKRLQWWIYIFGGVGALLAALGLEVWIALTTALVTAVTTYLEYQQVENTLMKYNQAATDLANVQGWWQALSPDQRRIPDNTERLVETTERILQSELTGWVQEMQDMLTELRAKQAREGTDAEGE